MTIEEIEELIRKYLTTGIAVVVILVAPGTATGGGAPEVITIDPSSPSDTRSTGGTSSNSSSGGTTGTRPSGGTTGSGTGSSNSGSTGTRPGTSTNRDTTNGTTGNGSSGTDSNRSGSTGSTSPSTNSGSTNSGSSNNGNTNSGTGSTGNTGTRPGGTTNNDNSGTNNGNANSGTNRGTNNNGTNNSGSSGNGNNSSGTNSSGNNGSGTNSSGTDRSGSTNGTGSAPNTGSGQDRAPGNSRTDTGSSRPRTGSTPDNTTTPGNGRTSGSATDDQRTNGNQSTTNGNNRTGNSSGTGTGSSTTGDGDANGDTGNRDDDAVSSTGSNRNSNDETNTGNTRGSDNSSSGVTAAEKFGWGRPNRSDDFSDGAGQWSIYDGPGHAGQGTRSPSAVSVDGGILTITGDSSGTTAGMAWNPGQKYGRWEGRVRAPESDPSYNALLLLWPDAEDFPVGGEIDFMEMMDHTRQRTNLFLHYGAANEQVEGEVEIDATQWHNWALEWTPDSITAFVDGEEWFRTTDTSIFPPGPMHLCIQLDWFPEGDNPRESRMEVDWVRQYSLDSSGSSNSDTSEQETRSDHNPDEESTPVRNVIRKMFSWR